MGVKIQENIMQILVRRLRITDQRLSDVCDELRAYQEKLEAESKAGEKE